MSKRRCLCDWRESNDYYEYVVRVLFQKADSICDIHNGRAMPSLGRNVACAGRQSGDAFTNAFPSRLSFLSQKCDDLLRLCQGWQQAMHCMGRGPATVFILIPGKHVCPASECSAACHIFACTPWKRIKTSCSPPPVTASQQTHRYNIITNGGNLPHTNAWNYNPAHSTGASICTCHASRWIHHQHMDTNAAHDCVRCIANSSYHYRPPILFTMCKQYTTHNKQQNWNTVPISSRSPVQFGNEYDTNTT